MESIITILLMVVAAFILYKLITLPLKLFMKLLINGISGLVLLVLTNFVGGIIGLTIPITFINVLIAGFFGIPGIIFLWLSVLFL